MGNTDFSFSTGPAGDSKLSAGSLDGGGTFNLGANELTVGGNNLSTNVTGIIADGGSGGGTGARLVKTGTGTMTLSGANTYTGGTTISAGALQIGNGGTIGSVLGNITNNAALIFNRSDAVTFGGAIGGSGTLVKTGLGVLTLTGTNTYTGGTTINSGLLQLGDSGNTGKILNAVTVSNAAAFDIVNADTSGITGITNNGVTNFRNSTSAGSAAIVTSFYMTFYDTATAGSATIANHNYLEFVDASSAGSAGITNNAALYFRNTATAGSATITNNGGGFLNFYSTSTAGNATISNAGSMDFRDGSTAGNATITNSTTLVFKDTSTAGSATIVNDRPHLFCRHQQRRHRAAERLYRRHVRLLGPDIERDTAGSLDGAGTFNLGPGTDRRRQQPLDQLSGVIEGGGGALVKTGTGTDDRCSAPIPIPAPPRSTPAPCGWMARSPHQATSPSTTAARWRASAPSAIRSSTAAARSRRATARGLVADGQRHARAECRVDLCGQRQSRDIVVRQRLRRSDARRRDRECDFRTRQLRLEEIHDPDRRQHQRHVRHADQHQYSGRISMTR